MVTMTCGGAQVVAPDQGRSGSGARRTYEIFLHCCGESEQG